MSNGSLFQVGVSGLIASQSALATVGHNISNANTDGYSRQQVQLDAIPGQGSSVGFIGKGVQVSTVTRVVDQFLTNQVQVSNSNYSRANTFNSLASQVNNLLADSTSGLSPALTSFFTSLQGVANDPSSTPQRQVALSNADSLVASFHNLSSSLDNINSSLNQRLQVAVDSINSLASSIANLNKQITVQQARAGGQPANDLLDQRDQAIKKLSSLVGVTAVSQEDGSVNVSVGNGQSLVVGAQSMALQVVPNAQDPSRSEVAYQTAGSTSIISGSLSGLHASEEHGGISGVPTIGPVELLDGRARTTGEDEDSPTERVNYAVVNKMGVLHRRQEFLEPSQIINIEFIPKH